MVIDQIRNASIYYGLGSGIETGLKYLQDTDLSGIEPGKHEIGAGCFAIVQDYRTCPREEKRWEAHEGYIDIQFIASGTEMIGVTDIESLRVVEDYDSSKDITWLAGDGDFATALAGSFVVLFPHDAHMPGVAIDGPADVRKVVVKVPVKLRQS